MNSGALFLVAGIGATAAETAALADALGAEIAVHALAPAAAGEDGPRTIEAAAAHCVRMIRSVQPAGPYRLAGWSFGGVVAYEVAAQLVGQDEAVEILALLDAFHPALLRDVAMPRATDDSGPHAAELARFYARLAANAAALNAYAVPPAPVEVHVFAADDRSGVPPELKAGDALLGWDSSIATNDVRAVQLPGTHESVVTVNAGSSATAIARTVREAAERGAPRGGGAGFEPKVTIQTGKARTRDHAPVFCVPGAGDHVVQFVDLVTELGDAWPVHGLQYRGVDDGLVPHASVEAAAAVYAKAIESVQPDGRVHLIGHSFGGWIAFEIALQLAARDRAPRSVTIIDSDAPDGGGGRDVTAAEVFAEYVRALELAAERPLGINTAVLERLDQAARLRLVHERMVAVGLMPRRSHADMLAGSMRAFGVALRAGYAPRAAYPGPVALAFASASDPSLGADADARRRDHTFAGWQRWAPAAARWNAPGNHITVLQPPHVRSLAEWWKRTAASEASSDLVRS